MRWLRAPAERRGFVDGEHDLGDPSIADDHHGLTRGERIELLTHRCFITVEKPHDDLSPYGDFYVDAAS